MERLHIDLGERGYPILIGPGPAPRPALVGGSVAARDVLVVTKHDGRTPVSRAPRARLQGKRLASSRSRMASSTRRSPR